MNIVFQYLSRAIRENPKYFAQSILLTILCAFLSSSTPWILQRMLVSFQQHLHTALLLSAAAMILILCGSIILEIIWNQSLDRFGGQYIKELLAQCQQVLVHADGYQVMQYPKDSLSYRLYANVLDVFRTIGHHIPKIIGSFSIVIILLAVSMTQSSLLCIFLLVAFLAGMSISYYSRKAIFLSNSKTNSALSTLHGHIVNFTDSISYCKVNSLEEEMTDQTRHDVDSFIQASIKEDRHVYFYSGIVKETNTIIQICFSVLLAYFIERGFTVNAAVYTLLFNLVMEQAGNAESLFQAVNRTLISFQNVDELLHLDCPDGTVTLEHIDCVDININSFVYPGQTKPVLKSLQAQFVKGDCILLKGKNGSGKSTLYQLLTKTIETFDGTIRVNGTCLSELATKSYLKQIAYVSQSEPLLNLPVKDYLRQVTHQRVLDQEIEEILDRLDFGESNVCIRNQGSNLSGGQVKKLLMAKLLILKSHVDCIFLDEIDAGLDVETRHLYEDIVNHLAREGDKIIFVVQHTNDSRIQFNKRIDF